MALIYHLLTGEQGVYLRYRIVPLTRLPVLCDWMIKTFQRAQNTIFDLERIGFHCLSEHMVQSR